MRNLLNFLFLSSLAFPSFAELIEEWGLEYNSVLTCKTNSDLCSRTVTLDDGIKIATKIVLIGPIKLAIANRQIVSCESNSIVGTQKARIFNLSGKEIAVVEHRGFLRSCDITSDGSLYWFHYNRIIDAEPKNILVVVTSQGIVVYEKTLSAGGNIKFSHNGKEYVVSIQAVFVSKDVVSIDHAALDSCSFSA